MAELSKKQIKDLRKKLQKLLDEIDTTETMKEVGEFVADRVRVRTRLGYGVKKDGDERDKLKKLSKPYVERRKALKEKGELSQKTNPRKSNLTKTGQMLDSIKTVKAGKGFAEIRPEGPRTDTDQNNEEIAQHVTDAGRPFMKLSKPEKSGVLKVIEKKISKVVRKAKI